SGISQPHCHGDWITLRQAEDLAGDCYAIMPRLHWLAPLKMRADGVAMNKQELLAALRAHMAQLAAPVMVADLREEGDWLVERRRGFVVPDDWRSQAAQRRRDGTLPA
ncbi:MAG: DUF1853 family protein, partial [Pseudomonadota bacterium]